MVGKKLALKAGKWAAKKGAKNARTKAANLLDRAARAVRPNPGNDPERVKVGDLLQFKDENGQGRTVWTRPVKVVQIEDARSNKPRGWLGAKIRFPLKPGQKRATSAWITLIPSPGAIGTDWRFARNQIKENPGYDHAGASFDLFGGESRRLPKKVSEFHRPRVRVRGGTMTLAEHSPFKGRVEKVNPAPRVVVAPLRVELTAAESKRPRAELVRKILQEAKGVRSAWDHVEVTGPSGAHLFDIIP